MKNGFNFLLAAWVLAHVAIYSAAAQDGRTNQDYWAGTDGAKERVMFCAGKYLYAVNPNTGEAIASFGENGRAVLPGRVQGGFGAATAGLAIFKEIIVVPGFEKDVWGFDAVTGKL